MINIPPRFKNLINNKTGNLQADLNIILSYYSPILIRNEAFFFTDFTDHGFNHINQLLVSADNLVTDQTFSSLSDTDIVVFIFAAILHDVGMHITPSGFETLINGRWDNQRNVFFDKKTWKQEWEDFLTIACRFTGEQMINIWGRSDVEIKEPNFDNLTEIDRKLIGEFIRRHHTRLAHEIARNGFPSMDDSLPNPLTQIDKNICELSGLIARSHGMAVRNTFDYLKALYYSSWKNPHHVKVVYWMAVLRAADYIQIEKDRAPAVLLKIKSFASPFSRNEWLAHNCVDFIDSETDDPERLNIHCSPQNAYQFSKMTSLFTDIQHELDVAWAVIGETYSSKMSMKYRRITSNINDPEDFVKVSQFIPFPVKFQTDASLLKLLISPLYNNDSAMGVRELLQNSIDACFERAFLERSSATYAPKIQMRLKFSDPEMSIIIKDNGVGMSLDTLKNYYFNSGTSYRNSAEWIQLYTNRDGPEITRSGRFGVGALATFLLGNEIKVETRTIKQNYGLSFTMTAFEEDVQIDKNDKLEIGTTITVKLKKDIKQEIINSKGLKDKDKLRWFCTYTKKNNFISVDVPELFADAFYGLKEDEILPDDFSIHPQWQKFTYQDMLIHYNYLNSLDDFRWKPKGSLICNGFKIKNGYEINEREFYWELPTVHVEDNNGRLPLSLDRNSIYNNNLPFERQLVENIAKNLIQCIQTLEFTRDGDFYTCKPAYINFTQAINVSQFIVCFKDHYTISLPFILSNLRCTSVYRILSVKNARLKYHDLFKEPCAYQYSTNAIGPTIIFSIKSHTAAAPPSSKLIYIDSGFRRKALAWNRKKRPISYAVHPEILESRHVINDLENGETETRDYKINMNWLQDKKIIKQIICDDIEVDLLFKLPWIESIFKQFYGGDYLISYDTTKRKKANFNIPKGP